MRGPTASTRPLYLRPGALALVVAGGAAGTALRALIEDVFPTPVSGWPWATFAINLAGSFLLGALLATLASLGPDVGRLRLARITVGTGLLGGFTTYSTFIVEVDQRLRGGHEALGAGYAVASVVLGVVAAFAGVLAAGARRSSVIDPDAPDDAGGDAVIVFVALAGGVGAALRFVVDGLVARRFRGPMPLGTLVINVTGSFLLGLVVATAADHASWDAMESVVGTGLLGGYTTFSTASVEAVNLARLGGTRPALVAAIHASAMLLLSLAAAWCGLWLG